MVFTTAGGGATDVTDTQIDNSLRFNDDDSPEISFTLNKSPTHQDKGTWSFWIKRANIQSAVVRLYSGYADGGATQTWIRFDANDCLDVANRVSASFNTRLVTNRKFRDPSAWYHIVVAFDTTDGTSSNRAKVYVNSVQETSFSTETYPSQNDDLEGNTSSIQQSWGCDGVNNLEYFDGYLSEVNFVDGQQLTPSSFGETNENGVWIPKYYRGNYGNNGYKLEFKQTGTSANSSGIGADTSGNDHHFTPTNLAATDVTEDTPTNNFCTLSSVDNDGVVLSEGNCNFDTSSGDDEGVRGTIGVQNGKWYYECKITGSAGMSAGNIGYANPVMELTENPRGGECVVMNGSITANVYNNSASAVQIDASDGIDQNDIIGVALDLDSGTKTIQFYKNGSTIGSAQTIASALLNDFLLPCMFDDGGVNDVVGSFNFGNPSFSISSGNSDANGYGNFEYAPPSGYYALCTKNLAEYG